MTEPILSRNYRRSLSASLMLVEKLILEIENFFEHPADGIFFRIEMDIESGQQSEKLALIAQIRQKLLQLHEKYQLNSETANADWLVKVRQSKIWEILSESNAHALRGYGGLDETRAKELDADIAGLLKLTEQLSE
jgi:hypothetical protein